MPQKSCRLIFITGTDTGVGKTVLTALLLSHLRRQGCHALAMKPFCSGSASGLSDVDILYRLQDQELSTGEINPFFFREPLAPLVAARRHRAQITLEDVLQRIHSVINNHLLPIQNPTRRAKAQRRRESKIQNYQDPVLLIEGAGGLLAPLGEGFNLLDVIAAMPPAFEDHGSWIKDQRPSIELRAASIQTIVVARNQLGTINHTLLTVQALRSRLQGFRGATNSVVLMNPARPDLSSHSNPQILKELLPTVSMFSLPYLPALAASLSKGGGKSALNRSAKRVSKTLEQLLDCPTLPWPERTSVS